MQLRYDSHRFADVLVFGAGDDIQLTRFGTACVKFFGVLRRGINVIGPGDEQDRRRRKLADIVCRGKMGEANTQTFFRHPDHACAEATEPARKAATDPAADALARLWYMLSRMTA